MREFSLSEKTIRDGDRSLLIFYCLSALYLLIFALYFSNFRIEGALIAVGKTLLIVGIIFGAETLLINRRLRKLTVLIYEDKLVRQRGKKQQILMWDDITRIKMVEKKNGNVVVVRLYPKKPAVTMHLYGFRETDDLANLIKERTLGKVILQEKRLKINWLNPIVGLLMFGVPTMIVTMIVMFIIASMGSKAIDIFAILVAFSTGLLLLIFRPLTKLDACDKWVEIAFVVVILISGLYGLIEFLQSGKIH